MRFFSFTQRARREHKEHKEEIMESIHEWI